MKSLLIIAAILGSFSSYAFEEDMCEAVASYDQEKCEKLVSESTFEMVPVELCQYRMTSGEMLECYQAVADKTYEYGDVLKCAAHHRYDIPPCMEEVGKPVE